MDPSGDFPDLLPSDASDELRGLNQSTESAHMDIARLMQFLNQFRETNIDLDDGRRIQILAQDMGTGEVAQTEVSRLQIVRTPPPSYDPGTQGALTPDDFFVSFGLYNGVIPSNIDDKITISGTATVLVWLEISISTTNPAYASDVVINHGTSFPGNDPPPTGEWPEKVYILLGKIEDDDGAWGITNYDNGNAGGGVYVASYDVDSNGVVTVEYGFSQSRF